MFPCSLSVPFSVRVCQWDSLHTNSCFMNAVFLFEMVTNKKVASYIDESRRKSSSGTTTTAARSCRQFRAAVRRLSILVVYLNSISSFSPLLLRSKKVNHNDTKATLSWNDLFSPRKTFCYVKSSNIHSFAILAHRWVSLCEGFWCSLCGSSSLSVFSLNEFELSLNLKKWRLINWWTLRRFSRRLEVLEFFWRCRLANSLEILYRRIRTISTKLY